jgi:hypothetical protein
MVTRKKRAKKERVFTGIALQKGWGKVTGDRAKVWWFCTTERFAKRYSLDGQGVPVAWDDEQFSVEEIKEGTGDDVCVAILNNDHEERLMLLVNTDMPAVLLQGRHCHSVTWDDYATEGLYAIKKTFPHTKLETVIINPKIRTLEAFGVVKPIIEGVVEETDFFDGGATDEPATK